MAFATFIPICYLHHIYAFSGQYIAKKKAVTTIYIIGFIFSAFCFSPLFIKSVSQKLYFSYWPDAGKYFLILFSSWAGLVIYESLYIYELFRKSSPLGKNQLKYVLIATLFGVIGGLTNFPLWFDIPILPVGNIFVSIYAGLIAYAIFKHRLLDIKVAITRAGIFIFVYTLVLGAPFGIGVKYLGIGLWLIPLTLMAVLATIGPYIYFYLRKQAEGRLFQRQLTYQKTLKQASYGIGKIKELETLVKLMDRILLRSVGIERCAIYLIDQLEDAPVYNLKNKADSLSQRITVPDKIVDTFKNHSEPFIVEEMAYHNHDDLDINQMLKFLKTFQSEIVIPIVQSDKLLCLVLLGKKKDHSIYTNDDLTVFTILSSQAGLAIENCLFMEAETERLKQEGTQARRESLDMMVSTMAHEIDNPITAAIGKSVMIEEVLNFFRSCLPQETLDELKQHAKDMMFNCQRVSKIVKAVEDYSKRETGKFKKVYINVVMVPTRSLLTLKQKLYKDTKYTEEVEDNLPPFWGEDIMFEEIVMNLVENAFMAVKHNEGEKWVHLHIFKKDEDYLRIEVTDNGYGIASKIKKQLFEVPTTTKGSSEGTGIGLYRVRQICELLKAKYGAESEGRGHGALFYVELPIYKEKDKTHGQ